MESDIINLTSYSGDPTWWLDWHHYAFVKKADVKQIWIDGELFLEASGAAVLPTDITALNIGSDNAGGGLNHAVVDDFAVFKKQLTEANLKALTTGTLPSALPAATGLIAYWDFNDAGVVAVTPTIGITASAITFTGVLQVSDTVSGPYVDVAGATSPRDITGTVSTKFWRTRAP
jgi:preprotein translocase subunit Sec61beta